MKILLFGMSSYPGGIENYLVNYFCNDNFPSDKIHIDFVTYEPTIAYEKELLAKGYTVCRVPHLKKHPIKYYKSIKKLITTNEYDAVYANMLTAANALPIFIARHYKVEKIILHAHANSTVDGWIRRVLHKINRKYCNRVATLKLACSKEAGEWLFDSDKFYVMPNAIDCNRFFPSDSYRNETRKKYNVSSETLLIGHVGRFATEKNHRFMIEILHQAIESGLKAKMMFVGDGYTLSDIKQLVADKNLTDNVIFIGTTSFTERYYPAFDVFLFPSTFEGFGMAALEAQCCGVPCVCSDTLSQLLNVTGGVKYCNLSSSYSQWIDAITQSLLNIDRNVMNNAVRNSNFNINCQVKKLLELIIES